LAHSSTTPLVFLGSGFVLSLVWGITQSDDCWFGHGDVFGDGGIKCESFALDEILNLGV